MTAKKNEAKLTKTGALVTPRGRLTFFGTPALFKPQLFKNETDQSKAKYQANILFPKDADMSLLKSTVRDRVNATNWTKPEKEKIIRDNEMFHHTGDDPYLSELYENFPVSIRTSVLASKGAPKVYQADLTVCTDETEVYGGRWARLVVNPWCYSFGGKGVTWELQLVQLLAHDKPLGGFARPTVEDSFEPVELDPNDGLEGLL